MVSSDRPAADGNIFYVAEHLLGVFVLNSAGDVVFYELRPKDLSSLAESLWIRSEGRLDDVYSRLIDKFKSSGEYREALIVVEEHGVARELISEGFKVSIEPYSPVFTLFRERVLDLYVKIGLFRDSDEARKYIRDVSLELSRRGLRRVATKRDLLAIQSIRAVDDIDKTINLFAARLREWYSIHFPELDQVVGDHILYAKIVNNIGDRSLMDEASLKKIGVSESLARRIASISKKSIGADLSEFDLKPIQTLAKIMIELSELRSYLTDYNTLVMKEVAPNVTELVGPLLGARLLSLAGSLEELAKMPASTIQVLGAEKALFRALRTGGKPPKHGVIFQYPEIHRSPRWQRGKIARALATKLAIAARVDFFTGRFIGDRLKKLLMDRIDEIKKLYQKPPPREERPQKLEKKQKRKK
ncbi:MAG: C/D box methylation guide ribonucleoprotein complex aNOP56 subunit [Desulfurococcales archaeon]|jgi:nucleolar protein 56|nr:C/D box methylation guide ribonucleoprotein complex aNOP56 subunit [Desulfurococcales archaeon]